MKLYIQIPSDEDKVRALAEYVAAKRAQEVGVIESCYSRVVSAAQEGHGTRLGPESQDMMPRQGPGSGDIHEVSEAAAKISLSQGLHSDVTSLYEHEQPFQPLTTALCKEQESTNPRGGRFSSSDVLERVSWTDSSTAMCWTQSQHVPYYHRYSACFARMEISADSRGRHES